jgi:hypothetical protein
MSTYATVARVKSILNSEVEPDLTVFDALNETASNELDAACRVQGFGTDPTPRTLTFCAPPNGNWAAPPARVVLTPPALVVTVVSSGGVALDPAVYQLTWPSYDRYAAIVRTDAQWWTGAVAVTGDFADLPPGPVPPEIVEAASVLVAGYLRRDRMPAGEVSGPEGLTFRPSNPWSDERVKRAIARYRIPPLTV